MVTRHLARAEPPGNLNFDANADATDIDILFANSGTEDFTFDLDDDGDVDAQDVNRLVLNVMNKRFGDTNLNEEVDIYDFNRVVMNYDPLEQNHLNGWAQGDFDGDRDVDVSDILRLVVNYAPRGYTPRGVSASTARFENKSGLRAAVAMTATPLRGANEVSIYPDSSAEGKPRVKAPSVSHGQPSQRSRAERQDNENQFAEEHLILDYHFQSARRRHLRVSPWQIASSELRFARGSWDVKLIGSSAGQSM